MRKMEDVNAHPDSLEQDAKSNALQTDLDLIAVRNVNVRMEVVTKLLVNVCVLLGSKERTAMNLVMLDYSDLDARYSI